MRACKGNSLLCSLGLWVCLLAVHVLLLLRVLLLLLPPIS
jgi:hypothetical protein